MSLARQATAMVGSMLVAVCLCGPLPIAAAADANSMQTVPLVYLGHRYPQPPPLQLVHRPPRDRGLRGAQYSLKLRNQSGRLVGYRFELIDALVDQPDDVVKRAKQLINTGQRLFITDLNQKELLEVAKLPGADNALFLNIHSAANALRKTECRGNIFHILPSYAMRADALAQYLISKHWDRWLLVRGKTREDEAFAKSIRRAAKRFGGTIVAEKEYEFRTGKKRRQTGHQQIATQMPELTRDTPEHDVVFVADEGGRFGLYLPYRTAKPRPVVGSYGLTANAWNAVFEKHGAVNLRKHFRSEAGRRMIRRDYLAWLAVKLLGKAVIRGGSTKPDSIHTFILQENLKLAGYKPRAMSFRSWNHQLRQQIIVSGPSYQVALAPIKGFLNPKHFMDTLGFPRRQVECRLNSE